MTGTAPRPVRDLIRAFVEPYGFTYAEAVGPSRRRDINRVRQLAMAHVKATHPRMSLSRLGQHFNRHLTTVRYSLLTVAAAEEA